MNNLDATLSSAHVRRATPRSRSPAQRAAPAFTSRFRRALVSWQAVQAAARFRAHERLVPRAVRDGDQAGCRRIAAAFAAILRAHPAFRVDHAGDGWVLREVEELAALRGAGGDNGWERLAACRAGLRERARSCLMLRSTGPAHGAIPRRIRAPARRAATVPSERALLRIACLERLRLRHGSLRATATAGKWHERENRENERHCVTRLRAHAVSCILASRSELCHPVVP
jgi:hypothetical protein